MIMIELKQGDCLELMKTLPDNSIDLIFCDPPYALGSKVIIKENGKPDYKKAVDFMNKWNQPDGTFWEEWFCEAKRVLKHGGHCLMFGMDRQLWFNCYYANLAGFTQKQSLYWYFISNYPKASDLSKNLDKKAERNTEIENAKKELGVWLKEMRGDKPQKKISKFFPSKTGGLTGCVANWELGLNLPTWDTWIKLKELLNLDSRFDYLIEGRPSNFIEAEREVVGVGNSGGGGLKMKDSIEVNGSVFKARIETKVDITTPTTPLAKKYEGIKYSVAPLKQTNETIMVFQKPYKTGSCLHDVLAMENGDETITCGGVDIKGNKCGVSQEDAERTAKKENNKCLGKDYKDSANVRNNATTTTLSHDISNGRFPAQTYIDSGAAEIIDRQSGVLKSDSITGVTAFKMGDTSTFGANNNQKLRRNDAGGASKILHKCDYDKGDYDLYHYCPKVSKEERNEGLDGFEEKQKIFNGTSGNSSQDMKGVEQKFSTQPIANPHPTVKPKALLFKILKLFKTPNQQVILDPFMGSGSMGISAVETGFDYIGYELDPEYFKIAEARIANTQSKAEQRLL